MVRADIIIFPTINLRAKKLPLMKFISISLLASLCTFASPSIFCAAEIAPADAEWISLFNGKDLDGWTVKIARHPLGVNFAGTFRVEEGIIKVSYEGYDSFDEQFGHLYTNLPYSHYILRLEYRFTGEVMPDAPAWTALNSGVMVHAQSPLSLGLEQSWPASLEGQFLAAGTKAGRQTGNACTPGTNLELNGELTTAHIIDSSSKLFPPGEWVTLEIEVHGHDEIIHRVNGVEVLRYQHPQLDPRDRDAQRLLAAGASLELSSGHIALQAEGQPVWFRNVKLLPLDH
ncbi:MAG: 3-keto-disaccharide hydrolase [Opitutaceae bacterium]